MPSSSYLHELRLKVGHSLLLLPAVTAVICQDGRFLLARQRDTRLWSLIGGSVEPREVPSFAVQREVYEELGVKPTVGPIVGAYGGPLLANKYPNGDEVSYVTIAYVCELPKEDFQLELQELIEVAWFDGASISTLPRHQWIDRVVEDAVAVQGRIIDKR